MTPPGLRAVAVQVDQVTGVGTVIKTGDYVDLISGVTGDKFPVITVNPADDSVTVVSGLNSTSVKILLQGMQVLGTLLPPAAQTTTTDDGSGTDTGGTPSQPGTALTGQQQIVILAVDAQQAEVIKFAQLDSSITLILRSPDDFIDPTTERGRRAAPEHDDRRQPQDPRRHLRGRPAGSRRDRDPRQSVTPRAAERRPS